MGTLRISGIDLKLLDKQRLTLVELVSKLANDEAATLEELDALDGIINMLDCWSDAVYRKEHPKPKEVTANMDQRLFVIPAGGGYSCLGFKVCFDWSLALAKELDMITALPLNPEPSTPEKAMEIYRIYEELCAEVRRRHDATGFRSQTQLHPQLIGLEGRRVEVVDQEDEKYRFKVGKSTGYIPCHIQLATARSEGGEAVDSRPFKRVTIIK